MKWKHRLTCSIDRMEDELSLHEEKIYLSETLHELFRHFKDNGIKGILNILHENQMVLRETVTLQRREKVDAAYGRRLGSSSSCLLLVG